MSIIIPCRKTWTFALFHDSHPCGKLFINVKIFLTGGMHMQTRYNYRTRAILITWLCHARPSANGPNDPKCTRQCLACMAVQVCNLDRLVSSMWEESMMHPSQNTAHLFPWNQMDKMLKMPQNTNISKERWFLGLSSRAISVGAYW